MLRLTDTRGSRLWPAAFQASRNRWICSAWSSWNGTPVSSVSSVELIRFMPCSAVHSAVRRDPAPHQIRSRSPGECGSIRSRPGGFGNIGRGFGFAKPSPLSTSSSTRVCSLSTVATTLRPGTVELRADSLITFSEFLAEQHPHVHSLTQLTRGHIEDFLAYNHRRPWRGRVARPQPVSASASKRTVIDLRCFFDELALWGLGRPRTRAVAVPQRHPQPRQATATGACSRRRPGTDGRYH